MAGGGDNLNNISGNWNGMPPQQLPSTAAGNKSGQAGPKPLGQPPAAGTSTWDQLTNKAGDAYGWAPNKGTVQAAGWNPWTKDAGFTRIPGFTPPGTGQPPPQWTPSSPDVSNYVRLGQMRAGGNKGGGPGLHRG